MPYMPMVFTSTSGGPTSAATRSTAAFATAGSVASPGTWRMPSGCSLSPSALRSTPATVKPAPTSFTTTDRPRGPPAPLTPYEELAWRALARAGLVIPRVLDSALLQAQGLGLTEYSVLMNLSEQPGRSMRMSELANAVLISVSGLTRVVERLTRQGLVERARAGTDGRGQLAVLTPAGFARLEKAYPTLLAGVREHVMDHLADLDLAAFTQAMSGIAAPAMGPPVRRTPTLAR